MRKKLLSPFVDRFTIDIPGPDDLSMTGDLFEHEYTITRADREVATVSKRWISLTDTYGVDIAPGEDDLLILTSVLAAYLRGIDDRVTGPRPQLDGHRIGFSMVADCGVCAHGLKFRSKKRCEPSRHLARR